MDIKMFYKTQREVAEVINILIDSYWNNELSEEALIENISKIYNNNASKVIKGTDFTTVLRQQCGKRRLEVVQKIIKI